MGAGITFDDSLWPLLICRYGGTLSDADFEESVVRGGAYLRRGEPYVIVFDMGRLQLPTVTQRRHQLEWMRSQQGAIRERIIGCAFILSSPFIRMALSAVFHVVPSPMPYVAVQDLDTAVRWACLRLEERGFTEAARRARAHFALEPEPR